MLAWSLERLSRSMYVTGSGTVDVISDRLDSKFLIDRVRCSIYIMRSHQ